MASIAVIEHFHAIYPGTAELVTAVRALRATVLPPRDRARYLLVVERHNDGLLRACRTTPFPRDGKSSADPKTAAQYPDDVWELLRPFIEGDGYNLSAEIARVTAVLALMNAVGDDNQPQPKRDQNKPAQERQDDILTVIRRAGTPLTREEILSALKWKREGKLGHNLAWMVSNGVLMRTRPHGYWPAGDRVPV